MVVIWSDGVEVGFIIVLKFSKEQCASIMLACAQTAPSLALGDPLDKERSIFTITKANTEKIISSAKWGSRVEGGKGKRKIYVLISVSSLVKVWI